MEMMKVDKLLIHLLKLKMHLFFATQRKSVVIVIPKHKSTIKFGSFFSEAWVQSWLIQSKIITDYNYGYNQKFSSQTSGLWVAVYFGLENIAKKLP